MSPYPPDHHALRDLRFETERIDASRSRGLAPVQPGILAEDGSVRVGALAMLVDVVAASVAIVAAEPDWSATADLAYWSAAPITNGPIICDTRLVRAGTGVIVIGADVYDGNGTEVPKGRRRGHARMTFARIPASASAASGRVDRSGTSTGRRSMSRPGSNYDDPLFDKIGLAIVDPAAGVVECPKSDYVRNSFGTINGGVVAVLFEAAAQTCARHQGRRRFITRDLQVHYLAQTRTGPARTSARVLRADDSHAVVELSLVDGGGGDHLLGLATATLTP